MGAKSTTTSNHPSTPYMCMYVYMYVYVCVYMYMYICVYHTRCTIVLENGCFFIIILLHCIIANIMWLYMVTTI